MTLVSSTVIQHMWSSSAESGRTIPGEFCGKFVGDDKAREMNTETARREEWRSRTPHGTCVEIFPTDYETEKAYQEAVAHAYSLTHRGL